ncbi:Rad17 cell cycle checkpoint protein-domain-containing protein [Stachybotrys elegans]|uniref:Rad17 cell cycle checkpoint protein-domain-containing protein n=1 Tax=Stachybotrys elegans TaxID=80388 RepID=A0A8K0WWV5_9HYPO|nr:Rad17 cell cycle checkpoint protein-domain-containing protein [Stachybotrys elegans]
MHTNQTSVHGQAGSAERKAAPPAPPNPPAGRQAGKKNARKRQDWLFKSTAQQLCSINSEAIEQADVAVSSSGGYDVLCAYNWLHRKQPTIYVPGFFKGEAPHYAPKDLPFTVEKDSGMHFIDQNASRVPRYPFEVVFRAIEAMDPARRFDDVDLLVNRNSLRKLLDFCSGRSQDSFRVNLFAVENTLIIERCERNAKEIIHGSFRSGFGHNFEHAITVSPPGIENTTAHHRVLRYNFGDLNCAVRFEVDACHGGTRTKGESSMSSLIDSFNTTLQLKPPTTRPKALGSRSVQVIPRGTLTAQSQAAEIKAWGKNKSTFQVIPQLWFGRTPWLIKGTHNEGVFDKIEVVDMEDELSNWESREKTQCTYPATKIEITFDRLARECSTFRRKRNTVVSSDDEDERPRVNTLNSFLVTSPSSPRKTKAPTASPSPVKRKQTTLQTRLSASQPSHPASGPAGLKPSPKKPRSSKPSDDKFKTTDLKTLFSRQVQRASQAPHVERRNTLADDPISDPISDDEISEVTASSTSLVGEHSRNRKKDGAHVAFAEAPSASQKFLRPPRPSSNPKTGSRTLDDDLRPWSERFGPRNLEELAVHKKKVADVRRWLEDVTEGRLRQRMLILKGAAGSGKTTTLRLLASDLGCELLEWKNPTGAAGTGFVSASAQFEDFLGRGGKFGTLDVGMPEPATAQSSKTVIQPKSKRVILIEEFPNTFSRQSTALTSFRSSLLKYLDTHTPTSSMFGRAANDSTIMPIVMVISETLLTTTSASADSFTAHRLLGPDILRHPGLGMIEFNAIAPSLLAKALELVVLKEARISGRRRTPGPMVLKRLGEIGDIRNAVSSLEFLCLKGDQEADWGAKVAFTKQKKSFKDSIALTQGEEDSLELISRREASLGIFHAVGKVVYNKRENEAPDSPAENLPWYMSHCSRPKTSQVSIDSLIDETGTDTHTFISALHENYVLSCESGDPMDLSTPIDYLNECIEYLSQSDLLCPSRDVFFGGRGGFGGADSASHLLRQDEMTFQVAVRGLLFSLPNPVKRKPLGFGRGGDAFKMFYPAGLKLWRQKEELEGLVDSWSSKLLRGEGDVPTTSLTDGANLFRRPQSSGETSWLQRQQQKLHGSSKPATSQKEENVSAPLLSLGSAARQELLLERLPYMAHIARQRKTAIRLRDLEKVVSFHGVGAGITTAEEADDAEDIVSGEAWATDKPSEEASPRKKSMGIRAGGMSGMLAQKLVLSDDDIED